MSDLGNASVSLPNTDRPAADVAKIVGAATESTGDAPTATELDLEHATQLAEHSSTLETLGAFVDTLDDRITELEDNKVDKSAAEVEPSVPSGDQTSTLSRIESILTALASRLGL